MLLSNFITYHFQYPFIIIITNTRYHHVYIAWWETIIVLNFRLKDYFREEGDEIDEDVRKPARIEWLHEYKCRV